MIEILDNPISLLASSFIVGSAIFWAFMAIILIVGFFYERVIFF